MGILTTQVVVLTGLFVGVNGLSATADDDPAGAYAYRRKAAQQALEARMESRFAAGWAPKSKDAQMVTQLERLKDKRIRSQELANTRAQFEAARAEVYMQLVRHYSAIGYYRRGYSYSYVQDRLTGIYRPVIHAHDYWIMDPYAARLSAYFGNKAARSKGIAAAQEYHANTYYERLIRNSDSRIAVLKQQISLDAQLALKAK